MPEVKDTDWDAVAECYLLFGHSIKEKTVRGHLLYEIHGPDGYAATSTSLEAAKRFARRSGQQ